MYIDFYSNNYSTIIQHLIIISFLVQIEELLEPYLKDTDLGLPYWNWLKNRTIPDLWENIRSPLKEWNERRFGPLGYVNITSQLMDGFRNMGCLSSSMNYGEVALRVNDTNILDRGGDLRLNVDVAMGQGDFWEFATDLQVKT